MTRVDHQQIAYLQRAELARAGLGLIPRIANQVGLVGRHDRLIAANVPLNEIPSRMEDIEPSGVSLVDFAVPQFLKSLYDTVCRATRDQLCTLGDVATAEHLWEAAMSAAVAEARAYHLHQELLARLQRRHLGPGALALHAVSETATK